MSIIFVIGPAGAGKSTFIKNNFSNYSIVDLYDFQTDYMTVESVMNSYIECKNKLVELIKDNKDVVLEHTLLKSIRRPMYIDAIKKITDIPIDVYVIKPNADTLNERRKQRKLLTSKKICEEELNFFDIPTIEEGFRNIYIIE